MIVNDVTDLRNQGATRELLDFTSKTSCRCKRGVLDVKKEGSPKRVGAEDNELSQIKLCTLPLERMASITIEIQIPKNSTLVGHHYKYEGNETYTWVSKNDLKLT
jgi:hypothetical protein